MLERQLNGWTNNNRRLKLLSSTGVTEFLMHGDGELSVSWEGFTIQVYIQHPQAHCRIESLSSYLSVEIYFAWFKSMLQYK